MRVCIATFFPQSPCTLQVQPSRTSHPLRTRGWPHTKRRFGQSCDRNEISGGFAMFKLPARARSFALALILLVLADGVFAQNSGTVESRATLPFGFVVQKGREQPLCVAYAENLNRVDWRNEPFCGRPIASSSKDFARFKTESLSAVEREKLEPQVIGLMEYGDAGVYFSKHSAKLRGLQRDARRHAQQDAEAMKSGALSQLPAPTAYRYEPAVDIDNDGVADDVTFWRETGYQCGDYFPVDSPVPTRAPLDAFVLGTDGSIDVRRSRAWFYPTAPLLPDVLAKEGGPVAAFGWRSSSRSIGILNFRGRTYIDNSSPGRSMKPRSGVIEVYEVKGESAQLRCEITWQIEGGESARSAGETK
jgi:hypothetical protein